MKKLAFINLIAIVSCVSPESTQSHDVKPFNLQDKFIENGEDIYVSWSESSSESILYKYSDSICSKPSIAIQITHKQPKYVNFCSTGLCDFGTENDGSVVLSDKHQSCIGPDNEPMGYRRHPAGNYPRSIYIKFGKLSNQWIIIPFNNEVASLDLKYAHAIIGDFYINIDHVHGNNVSLSIFNKKEKCFGFNYQKIYTQSLLDFEKFSELYFTVKYHGDNQDYLSWWYGNKKISLVTKDGSGSTTYFFNSDWFDLTKCHPPQDVKTVNDLTWEQSYSQ